MEWNKATKRAVFGLVFMFGVGLVTAWMVANDMPVTKEFWGTVLGSSLPLASILFAAQAKDDSKKAREGSERAEAEARKTDGDKVQERGPQSQIDVKSLRDDHR